MNTHNFVKHMRIAVKPRIERNEFDKIYTAAGTSFYVQNGYIIQLLSEIFQFSYDVTLNSLIGESDLHGNWTGCIGSVQRQEADIAICSIAVTDKRSKVVTFTHPYTYSPFIFATDKPQNIPNKFAMFYAFSSHIWHALALCFLFMSFFIYIFFRKKRSYSAVLLNMFGILVEQSFKLKYRMISSRLIIISWILGVMCLSYSYKAVLLATFSFPTLSGIHDIEDLSKAAQSLSFYCIANKRNYIYKSLMESDNELIKPIAKCLKRTPAKFSNENFLLDSSYKKAAIYGKIALSKYKRKLFLSDDVFFTAMAAVAVHKKFRYFDALNSAILRINEAGFILRYQSYTNFYDEINDKYVEYNNASYRILKTGDLLGAFIIFIIGLLLSILMLVTEIFFCRVLQSLKEK